MFFNLVFKCVYISESIGTCLSRIYNLSLYVMDRIMPIEIQLDFLCLCLLNFTSIIGRENNILRVAKCSVGSVCNCVSSMSYIYLHYSIQFEI